MTAERWLPVCGYEGLYEASDQGRVRSLDRTIIAQGARGPHKRTYKGKILRPGVTRSTGYLSVILYKGNKGESRPIHVLVATAFLGPGDGLHVLHCDGSRDNNRLENLRWGTRSDNLRDAVRHGTHPQTKKTHCPHGHEYTPENTLITPTRKGGTYPARRCLTCKGHGAKRKARDLVHAVVASI